MTDLTPMNRAATMKRSTSLILSGLIGASMTSAGSAAQELDETWTVTVDGLSVLADPDGTFRIANVVGLDQFGAGGPGSPPDGLIDALVRIVATRPTPAGLEQAFSEPFQVPVGGVHLVDPDDLTFFSAPPLPVSLSLAAGQPVLGSVGATTQVTTLATQSSGAIVDVTAPSQWTTYITSNAAIATIDPNGLVTATGEGSAFLTAKNDGTAATALVQVVPESALTTIVGFVLEPDGTAVAGADVEVLGQFATAQTGADGAFLVSDVITSSGALSVSASGTLAGQSVTSTTGGIEPNPDGFTDAGLILLEPFSTKRFLYADARPPGGAGPPSLYGWAIEPDGDLSPVPGSPFASGFVQFTFTSAGSSLATTIGGDFLYRAGESSGALWGYAVGADGSLSELSNSPFAPSVAGIQYYAPMAATPGGLLVTRYREGSDYGIRTLRVEPDGSLTDTGHATPLPTAVNARMGLAVNATGTLVAVSWEDALFDPGSLRSYLIQPDGQLVLAGVHPNAGDPSAIAFARGDTRIVHVSYGATPYATVKSYGVSPLGVFDPFGTQLVTDALLPGLVAAPDGMALGADGATVHVPIRLLNCSHPGEVASLSTLEHAPTGDLGETFAPVATALPTAASPIATAAGDLLFLFSESQTVSCDLEVLVERYALDPGAPPAFLGTTSVYGDPLAFGGVFGYAIAE